jgi:VanZ family protein
MISIGLLLAGFWPFNFFPRNNVQWLPDQEALRFEQYGIAYSPQPFAVPGETLDFRIPILLGLKIRPLGEPGNSIPRILSICDDHYRELFVVGQWKNHLIIRLANVQESSSESYWEIGVDNLFRKNESLMLEIRSDNSGLSIFADGSLVLSQAGYSLSRFSGLRTQVRLLLGNSPTGESPWKGDLLCLSIHQHIGRTETLNGTVMTFAQSKEESGAFLRTGGKIPFLFFIPSTYRPIKKTVLFPPWKETSFNRSFWKDVFVNILGFIPFGFFFYAWLRESSTEKNFPTILRVVLLGAGIILAIELLQVFLPSRDSSLTDVINNILGAYLGAWLFRKTYQIIFS